VTWVLVIILWFAYRALDPIAHGELLFRARSHDIPLNWDSFVAFELLFVILAAASVQLQRKSPDILRWMPTGRAPEKMRELINGRLVQSARPVPLERSASKTPDRSYQLFAGLADAGVEKEVDQFWRSVGYKPSDTPGIQTFVLINFSNLEELKQDAGQLSEQATAVVATSIRMPDRPEELFRFQWVDYRRRLPDQLRVMLGSPRHGGLMIVPESLERLVVPRGISFVTNALRSFAALVCGAGLYLSVLPLFGKTGSWSGIPMTLVGMALYWMAGRLTLRRIYFWPFVIASAVCFISALGLDVGSVLWTMLQYYGANERTGEPTLFGYAYLWVLLAVPPAVALYYGALIRRWLPLPGKRGPAPLMLQIPTPRTHLLVYGAGIVLIVFGLLASTQ